MKMKRTAAAALSAAALVISGAGVSHAGEGAKFRNDVRILPCVNLELANAPIASADTNNLDCSITHVESTKVSAYDSFRD
ncbi:hypothetical protein [Streptomyces sp. CNQ085]|uniref:hypothetical protein n=1 Tax=Streptomyces sp. CNQ085 TaxID=2886944 RepID=UPI001F512BB2|nr:hypothetical protein [Streptomyces sp. CNQ085]MCI0383988.1 hypothetical protein [Streptomyces sp. CNQ085]